MDRLGRLSKPSAGDVIAGISVALVAIPQSLAYAELAGLPAQFGLYATALPSLLAAIFVSSKYLQTGPVALTALLTFGALEALAEPFSVDYISLAALLALLVGLMRVALGLLRLGGVAYLLSEPVLMGFTTGAAILILSSQLPKVFDIAPAGDGVLQDAWQALRSPGDWQWQALAFSAMTFVLIFGGRRLHKLFPGVLCAVLIGVVISEAGDYGGSIVGELDGGFISLNFDFPWDSIGDLLLPAFAIALVGFAEPSSIARTFAAEERLPWNANREMFSQGVANLASALSGAFPVGGSFSRSSLNRLAGATSAWAGAISGAFVLLALPLTPMLERLPRAILGAIVVGAVLKLINWRGIIGLISASRPQAVVGIGTLVATLASAPRVERGVLIGVGLALSVHLFREMTVSAESEREGDTLTVTPHGVLWFASVPQVERSIRQQLAEHAEVSHVVVDLHAVSRLDYSGAASLARIVEELRAAEVRVEIVNVNPGARRGVRVFIDGLDD
ncbi:MAG: SulP family inorganic anion transporter [Acidimicrobiales bacterium]|nr:SulP family inorganic anion transporter [Acidimicrobiales bacterium]